jgi:hypothetical protein
MAENSHDLFVELHKECLQQRDSIFGTRKLETAIQQHDSGFINAISLAMRLRLTVLQKTTHDM